MKSLFAIAALSFVVCGFAAPAAAKEVAFDDVMCPMEGLGEEKAQAFSDKLAASAGVASDEDVQNLAASLNACSVKHGWSADDSKSVLQFNLSLMSVIGLEKLLLASGVEVSELDALLDEYKPEALQAMVDSDGDSPIIDAAVEKLDKHLGDKLTPEIAGNVGAYLVSVAQAQIYTFKMMGLAE
jgi:hypothetical protein